MKLFEDLDAIIQSAINETMKDERARQKDQSSKIEKLGLRAADTNESESEVSEAEEEEAEEEEAEKLKGEPSEKKKKEAPDDDDETPGTATSKKLKDPTSKQIKKPTFKAIANNINLLRGGKSIKDPEVKANLQDYIDKLSVEERRQVLVYLNSLAQVMAGKKTGAEAEDPSQAERQVSKKKEDPKKPTGKKSGVIVVGKQ
tara:strand:+ start:111 stop:713 length:603 start_codon:yes stop_codon:yes gene_type:complete